MTNAEPTFQFQYAGFWIRLVATIIDEVIVMIGAIILTYLALGIVYVVTKESGVTFAQAFTGMQIQLVELAAGVFISIPYHIGFHYKQGSTPGKRMLRIVVRDYQTGGRITLSQSIWRYTWSGLSGILMGAGYLMVAFHPKKRALHELLSGTVSLMVEKPEPPVSHQYEAQE